MANQASMKVGAFREFATQLAVQVVEQLCGEYEREVTNLYSDVYTYRVELERVAELLGHQLHREKQLHDMLATAGDVHSSVVAQMEHLSLAQPDPGSIHDMVERLQGTQVNIINSGLSGISEGHSIASTHAAKAHNLKEQTVTAEHEFNRIMQLLQSPLIPGNMPTPTTAPMISQSISGQGAFRSSPAIASFRSTPPTSPTRGFNNGLNMAGGMLNQPRSPGSNYRSRAQNVSLA